MNRAPGPKDFWFPKHQATCGGTFVKIEGPEKPAAASSSQKSQSSKSRPKSPMKKPPKGTPDIRNFFPGTPPDKPPIKPGHGGNNVKSIRTATATSTSTSPPVATSNVKSLSDIQNETVAAAPPVTNAVPLHDAGRCGSSRSTAGPFKPFAGTGHVLGSGPITAAPPATQRIPLHSLQQSNERKSSRLTTIEVVADPVPIELIELD
jgi:hypothetical protein